MKRSSQVLIDVASNWLAKIRHEGARRPPQTEPPIPLLSRCETRLCPVTPIGMVERHKGSRASGLTEPRPLPKLLGDKRRDRMGRYAHTPRSKANAGRGDGVRKVVHGMNKWMRR
jgi:hypothetical protein